MLEQCFVVLTPAFSFLTPVTRIAREVFDTAQSYSHLIGPHTLQQFTRDSYLANLAVTDRQLNSRLAAVGVAGSPLSSGFKL